MSQQSLLLLNKQLRDLTKNPVDGFSAGLINDNLFHWQILIIGPQGTPFEGGFFKCELKFPEDYPQMPPTMRHPNVHENGDVCISILHAPGDDKYGYEEASERWLPIHTVESIVISVISMLSDPNDQSPANIDAAKEWREDNKAFNRRIRRLARKTTEEE